MRHNHKHINDFRTTRYRVFYAAPYLSIDLPYEIDWHEEHLKKLRKHAKHPHLFHASRSSHPVDEQRVRHWEEQVLNSIPFHERILDEQRTRLKTILSLMTKRQYRKLSDFTMRHGGLPEFLVYDKLEKAVFFVSEGLDERKRDWIAYVRDKKKFFDVVVLL